MGWKYYKVGSRYSNPAAEPDPTAASPCTCGGPRAFSHTYDAAYCPTCDCWLERACGNRSCDFCGRRPHRPSQAPYWRL